MLDPVLLLAIGEDVLTGGGGGEFGRSAVLVGGADVEHLVTAGALEPRVDIGRQHRSRQVAEVLDAVNVRQGGGDKDTGHESGAYRTARALFPRLVATRPASAA